MKMPIPYGRHHITEDDVMAVSEVLRSDWITQGETGEKFEKSLANYCGARRAVSVSSATAALHLACIALGLQRGDNLWTTPITFVASANCALYCGATVDFVDIDAKTNNLCVKQLRSKKLEAASLSGSLPKIVVAVHLAGLSCEMHELHKLKMEFGFHIIEDASHALGATYLNTKVGSCKYSDISVFSFHPVKIITTGEGGAITTNCEVLARKIRLPSQSRHNEKQIGFRARIRRRMVLRTEHTRL